MKPTPPLITPSKPPTSNFGLGALNKRDAKMGEKGLGMSSIAIKSDSEQSDPDDKI
jgi:hypothetical protein